MQRFHQVQSKLHNAVTRASLQPIELRAVWQTGKSPFQMTLSIPLKGLFTGEAVPLAEHSQRHDLAAGERCIWPRIWVVYLTVILLFSSARKEVLRARKALFSLL
jgi:hypothetical protein